ncbi:hypothetical protein DFH08DRAFT_817771 [Mycena albidolilacea]|uniref:Uncharacterized protein n=1 Tax=Mycena albidolilacea TaxID=1033008 RepID=A0AAD7EH68_9AGAR|nr:hypothetical protein DFH08DRAFT_817771 [Mycena albidolilacea]
MTEWTFDSAKLNGKHDYDISNIQGFSVIHRAIFWRQATHLCSAKPQQIIPDSGTVLTCTSAGCPSYRPGDTSGTCGGTGPKDQATRVSGASGFILPLKKSSRFQNLRLSCYSQDDILTVGNDISEFIYPECPECLFANKLNPAKTVETVATGVLKLALWRVCQASLRQQVGGSILMPHPRKFPVADSFGDKLTSGVALKEDNRNGARLLRLLSG